MIERGPIEAWLASYRHAWSTDSANDVRALFTPDVRYYTAPHSEPIRGIDQVLAWWLGMKESTLPWTFQPEVLAQEGGLYVVRAVTDYPAGAAGWEAGKPRTFYNLWLVTLADDGRAAEFVEYYNMPD
jgi:hypothetical protein